MTTMLLIQGVGSVTHAITPCSTNSSSFCFSSILSGSGTLRGLFWTGLMFLSICILYSPGSLPSPENTSLQLSRTPSLVSDLTSSRCLTHSTLKAISWSAELARPEWQIIVHYLKMDFFLDVVCFAPQCYSSQELENGIVIQLQLYMGGL